jgi:hypothetical protein
MAVDPDQIAEAVQKAAEAALRKMLVLPPHLSSTDPRLIERSADLNVDRSFIDRIACSAVPPKPSPIVRYVNSGDIVVPPAPAWYIPSTNDIYVHVDAAEIKGHLPMISAHYVADVGGAKAARIGGLVSHEAGHAAISDGMVEVEKTAPQHGALLTLLEELRVENYAVRTLPDCRRLLRASMALVLANLPAEFESKGHIVRAWTLCHGRTLAGVSDQVETQAIDTAARTMLTDDVVDGLTDLLQEALTLDLTLARHQARMVEICDEWVALIGEPPETVGCTSCARAAKPGEKTDNVGGGGKSDEKSDDDAEDGDASGGGSGDEGDDDADGSGDAPGAKPDHGDHGGHWGNPGAESNDPANEDIDYGDTLTDEDAELMSALMRDAAHLLQEEWSRDRRTAELANASEWAAKVFGNQKQSSMLTESEPTVEDRQAVVAVANALSSLVLPAISKTSKSMVVPPGKLRSREALRASAERARGLLVTAKPWAGTVRRHSSSRPLVIGVATDTSGSMGWAATGVAQFAYVYANAGHRIGARTAAVTFGDRVARIARPGEIMSKVLTKPARDGSEEFDWAMASLDGVLHLTTPAYSARILFIVSDGALVKGGESDRAVEWIRKMDQAGTHVIWMTDHANGPKYLQDAAKRYSHFTIRGLGKSGHSIAYGGSRSRAVFDALNAEALKAIAHDIT